MNAAGFIRTASLATPAEEAETNWDAVIDANLKGSFLMVRAAAPLLASPRGRVINISSIGAQTGGSRPGALAYAAAKSGLHGLTYALARELAPVIVAETPMGRPGTPADISGAVLWLLSPAGGFVTGAVNGGWRIG